jgi:two-component system, OmpR family, response regulator
VIERSEALMAKVLVIEDDTETANQIVAELSSHGFEVDHEATGTLGLERASTGSYDAITLDRRLPGLDGLTVVELLRQKGVKTPVLLLSALVEVEDRVRGLRAGGDDYLTKPFAFAELNARVDALLRRSPEPRATLLRIQDLEVDLVAHSARRATRILELQLRELRLLEYLMQHHGQVVTRAMLFEQVWHYHFDPRTNLIDVHIGRLRRKVDLPGEVPLIHTVRGIGFVLRAPV